MSVSMREVDLADEGRKRDGRKERFSWREGAGLDKVMMA